MRIRHVVVLVRNQEEALKYYTEKLGFRISEDSTLPSGKRWLALSPSDKEPGGVLLALAGTEEQLARVGNQTGGKVLLVLHTDSFDSEVEQLKSKGVKLVRGPVNEPWGKVAVFSDLYGNLFDLVQPEL
ncbi:MAG: hypothetical protein RL021_350 [Bacteroidota bacterium]|jgi:catechol 2,3-dioxygenase-like lactoylglutathione lyase family enzyme